MDDLGAAISGFLSQPGAMEQLEAMAKQLGLNPPRQGNAGTPGTEETEDPSEKPGTAETLEGLNGLLGAGGLLPEGMTPEKLGKLMQAVSQGNQPNQATALLEALRPLLGNGKQEKLDRALQAVRLMNTAKAVTKFIEL